MGKNKLLFVFIVFIFHLGLYSQSINFIDDIDRKILYQQSSILLHNNKIYLNSQGVFDIFAYDNSGNIDEERYIHQNYLYGKMLVKEDTLYVLNYLHFYDEIKRPYFSVYNIGNNNFTQLLETRLNFTSTTYSFKKSENYLFFSLMTNNITYVYYIDTFAFVDSIFISPKYDIYNNYLFELYNTTNINSIQLRISDISNINSPNLISTLTINNIYSHVTNIKYHNNKLFILQEVAMKIVDVSDISNPQVIGVINNIPNIPITNYWVDILFYNDYMFLYNSDTCIWIYDNSDIENPFFLRYFTDYNTHSYDLPNSFKHIYIDEENSLMFISNNFCGLSSFDISNLPDIELLNTAGTPSTYFNLKLQLFSNKIFYTRYFTDTANLYYFNFDDNSENRIIKKLDNYGFFDKYCTENDSIFIYHKYYIENDTDSLIFCKTDNDTIKKVCSTYYEWKTNDMINNYTIIGDNLLIFNQDEIKIFSLNNDNFMNQIGEINPETDYKLVPRRYDVLPDYIFITYSQGYAKNVRIYQNFPPFAEICDFYVLYPDNYDLYLLSEHLLLKNSIDNSKTLLYYDFPDSLNILDTLNDPNTSRPNLSSHYFLDKNIFCEKVHDFDTKYSVYKFIPITDSGHFGTPFYYNFDISVYDVLFLPDVSKMIVLGQNYLQEYSYQLTGSEDYFITPISKPILLNYPNPFNPTTTISFNSEKRIKNTQIAIYNLKGQKIRDISVENCKAGTNKVVWDGKDNTGKKVASGVYLYSLKQNGKTIATKKMIMLK